jgi:hypothetical protein
VGSVQGCQEDDAPEVASEENSLLVLEMVDPSHPITAFGAICGYLTPEAACDFVYLA